MTPLDEVVRESREPGNSAMRNSDPAATFVSDPRHSNGEERFVLLGLSKELHLLAVMYTERRRDSDFQCSTGYTE